MQGLVFLSEICLTDMSYKCKIYIGDYKCRTMDEVLNEERL